MKVMIGSLCLISAMLLNIGCSKNATVPENTLPEVDNNYKERVYYNARLEPEKGVLHGAGQSQIAFCNYANALENKALPKIYMMYIALNDSNIDNWLTYLLDGLKEYPWDIIPQIGLTMTQDGGGAAASYEDEVAAGKYDANIEKLCQALKNWGKPAFVRIGYEFNGSWNGYSPETYRQAFRRVTDAFRRHNLDQVATVWCFGEDTSPGGNNDYMMFFPGEEYVDWFGIDLFLTQDLASEHTRSFLETASEYGKPVIIGESTPRHVGVEKGKVSWYEWYAPYFEIIRNNPQIKAFCYINWDWSNYPQWVDWGNAQIQDNEFVMMNYRNEMKCDLYIHAEKRK